MPTRKRPVTWQEHEEAARVCIEKATSRYADLFGGEELMRQAKRHIEAARMLKALEDLHK